MSETKNCPRDAQVMAAILKDMGISEYEPRVVNLMLEFTYRKNLCVSKKISIIAQCFAAAQKG